VKASSQQHVTGTLPLQRALVPTEYEAGWAPELICTSRRRENTMHLQDLFHRPVTEKPFHVLPHTTQTLHTTRYILRSSEQLARVSNSQLTKHSKTLSFCINFRQVLAIMHIILHPGIEILNPLVLYRWWSYFKPPGTVRMVTVF